MLGDEGFFGVLILYVIKDVFEFFDGRFGNMSMGVMLVVGVEGVDVVFIDVGDFGIDDEEFVVVLF